MLPEGYQRAGFLLQKGAIDMIVDRREMREELARRWPSCKASRPTLSPDSFPVAPPIDTSSPPPRGRQFMLHAPTIMPNSPTTLPDWLTLLESRHAETHIDMAAPPRARRQGTHGARLRLSRDHGRRHQWQGLHLRHAGSHAAAVRLPRRPLHQAALPRLQRARPHQRRHGGRCGAGGGLRRGRAGARRYRPDLFRIHHAGDHAPDLEGPAPSTSPSSRSASAGAWMPST